MKIKNIILELKDLKIEELKDLDSEELETLQVLTTDILKLHLFLNKSIRIRGQSRNLK